MFRDINNGNMAYYHTRKRFNLAGFSFKEISSNLRKFYSSFKEMCEIGSESPVSMGHGFIGYPKGRCKFIMFKNEA